DSIIQGVAGALHIASGSGNVPGGAGFFRRLLAFVGRGNAISGARDRGTSDPVAYDDFLKAQFSRNLYTGILYLKDAVKPDPKFARAYAALAYSYATIAIEGIVARDSAMAPATENLRKAEAIDSTLIEVYQARGAIAFLNVELVEAAAALSKAVALDSTDAR